MTIERPERAHLTLTFWRACHEKKVNANSSKRLSLYEPGSARAFLRSTFYDLQKLAKIDIGSGD